MIGAWTFLKFGVPAALIAMAIAYGAGFFKGKAVTNAAWQAMIAAERAAQDAKIREADETAFREIDRLNTEKEARNALIAQLTAEAAKDPRANDIALPANSMRRINRARPQRSQ